MNILITGAAHGLGAGMAAHFATSVSGTIILTSRDEKALTGLKNHLQDQNPDSRILIRKADLTLENETNDLVSWVTERIDSLDILINNAGQLVNLPFDITDDRDAERIFRVNYFAPARLIRGFEPLLEKAGHAHVVNIGSMGGFQGSAKFPGLSHYSASKGALGILTECLAEEYKDRGISFNCLALGSVATDMFAKAFPGSEAPLTAAGMARFIVDFARNGHHFMNGRIVPVALTTP